MTICLEFLRVFAVAMLFVVSFMAFSWVWFWLFHAHPVTAFISLSAVLCVGFSAVIVSARP